MFFWMHASSTFFIAYLFCGLRGFLPHASIHPHTTAVRQLAMPMGTCAEVARAVEASCHHFVSRTGAIVGQCGQERIHFACDWAERERAYE